MMFFCRLTLTEVIDHARSEVLYVIFWLTALGNFNDSSYSSCSTLEKSRERKIDIMFFENYDNVTQLTNQVAQADKTLKRMESQLAVNETVNEVIQNQIITLERQFWKNEMSSR